MSSGVTQVKKRFAEMATYLHKDEKGQQLLKLLKDDVNVLRTSLAAANAAKDAAVALMETARQRADKAETVAALLVESNKRLQDQNNSLQSQVTLLSQRLEATEELEEDADDGDTGAGGREYMGALRVMRRLRRTLPKCPTGYTLTRQQVKLVSDRGCVFERHDITAGWAIPDMWLLGATVAMISGVFGQCVVLVHDDYIKSLSPDGCRLVDDPKKLGAIPLYQQFVRWFGPNLARLSEEETKRKALITAAGYRPRIQISREISQDDTITGLGLDGNVGPEDARENDT